MDDLEEVTIRVERDRKENLIKYLEGSFLEEKIKFLLMDILIQFNRIELNLKRLVTYEWIKTNKELVKTLPLIQLLEIEEIINYFDLNIQKTLVKVKSNFEIRNLIAHSIPTQFDSKYIVFISHDIAEQKKIRTMQSNINYKYRQSPRVKKYLSKENNIEHTNYSVLRLIDISRLNELLVYVANNVQKIVNNI